MRTPSSTGPPRVPDGEILLTKEQLAQHLGKSQRTIDYWRKQIGLPCFKIKHSVLFRLSEVMRHLEKTNGQPPTSNAPGEHPNGTGPNGSSPTV